MGVLVEREWLLHDSHERVDMEVLSPPSGAMNFVDAVFWWGNGGRNTVAI